MSGARAELELARMLLRDTILERAELELPAEFPFTGGHVQRMARRRNLLVGEHRALRMVTILICAGDIVPHGSYRQDKGYAAGEGSFRVTLFLLPGSLLRKAQASVRGRRRVKRRKASRYALSWAHPLFGMPDGRPPPEWTKRQRRRRRSLDEQLPWWERSAWA